METVNVMEWLLGIGATIIGFVVRRLYIRIDGIDDKISELKQEDRLMEHRLSGHREHVAQSYLSKRDHETFRTETHNSLVRIEDKLDRITDKLEAKVDK